MLYIETFVSHSEWSGVMAAGRIFFTILSIAFLGLFAAVLAPTSGKLAGRSWELFVCAGRDCPSGMSGATVRHAMPQSLEPAQKKSTS
jgi:hypothetical protein